MTDPAPDSTPFHEAARPTPREGQGPTSTNPHDAPKNPTPPKTPTEQGDERKPPDEPRERKDSER